MEAIRPPMLLPPRKSALGCTSARTCSITARQVRVKRFGWSGTFAARLNVGKVKLDRDESPSGQCLLNEAQKRMFHGTSGAVGKNQRGTFSRHRPVRERPN
jgi:hypothetical protein